MITVEEVLNKMMRVPARSAKRVVFDIDAFLRWDNAERIRATEQILAKFPREAHPYIDYGSTRFERGKWRHLFFFGAHKHFGVKRSMHYVACRMNERLLPTIHISVKYHDPHHDCNYFQNAYLSRRTGRIELQEPYRARRGGFDENDLVLEYVDDVERMH